MKSFGINIQQWFRKAFAIPAVIAPPRLVTETHRMKRAQVTAKESQPADSGLAAVTLYSHGENES